MSFSKWFATTLATRLFIGIPLELLCYITFFGGVVVATVWHTPLRFWNDPSPPPIYKDYKDFFFEGQTIQYIFGITAITGALLILTIHARFWLFLTRFGPQAMFVSLIGPFGFIVSYLAGAFCGKFAGEHFLLSVFSAMYKQSDPRQAGMIVGAVIFGGLYLLASIIFVYARRSFYRTQSYSPTVVERAKERVLR